MALINCSECNNQISDQAISCPKCGKPVEKPKVQEEKNIPHRESKVHTTSYSQEEKKPSFKWFWSGLLSVAAIVTIIIIYNNPNSIPGVKIQVNTPKPIIATQRLDNADATTFDFKETVYATLSNQGGDGNVIVNFHLTQAGKIYNKTMQVYLSAGQNLDVKQVFDEVSRFGGEMRGWVDAAAR